ncbi:MAG: SDR family oxidoreductase [Verrucomicrobia bacterium]|nr:SDR family oxidoreductase [Verrucomicrobiota bacterium]
MEKKDTSRRDTTMPSRREFVGGITAGLVAALAGPALAQGERGSSTGAQATPAASDKQNPASEYPKPPFPRQSQDPPGLASKMTPRPDHGERSYKGSGRLTGRKALVTGGDSGIGRAAAIAYAREGADVAINYLPVEEPDASEVIELIRAEGRKAVGLPGDIRDEAFCKQLVDNAVRELGGLDILVNNAAKQHAVDSILELTTDQLDATFKTNLYAMFWITKAAVPHLQPGSSIVNTASVQAYEPSANLLDYAQTKAAIVAFTKALAKQLAPKGIRVNAVAPGPIWTPLQVSGGQPTDKLETFGGQTPMGRPGQPAELGPVYVVLAASESSYATGQVYGAAGGTGNP